MKRAHIRVWRDLDLDEVKKHLLIAGDISGDCANCREIGIDFNTAKACPKCKTAFNYIATRTFNVSKESKRLQSRRPDLTVIDLSDYKEAASRDEARELFGG